ncbi:MAG: hypothetical protein JWN14_3825 [Chthonomonadales bacterium]|nr:hypothetical protein [Chthonomonadales bacterium]
MVLQTHHVPIGDETQQEFVVALRTDASVLYFHHSDLDERAVELVEMHAEHADKEPRRFLVVDTFCCDKTAISASNLRFISVLAFKNHLWNFFEVVT